MSRSSTRARGGNAQTPLPSIPGHEPVRLIGRGGYGEVWLVRNVLGAYRAAKVVYRDNFDSERPFVREFEGIRRFETVSREHVGLVDVLQVGRDERLQAFFYLMELADDVSAPETPGAHPPVDPATYSPKTLHSLLHRGQADGDGAGSSRRPLPVRQCLEIGRDLASALAYLHRHNLVHRDIKPANIIFVNGVPKLADIGLVAHADQQCSFVGTVEFVPPEGPGRPQADVFALGKVLYEMLTGFAAREYPRVPEGWAAAKDHEELQSLNEVVLHACQGDAKRRYPSAAALCTDLDLLMSGRSLAVRKLQRRLHQMRWAIAGVAAASVLAFSSAGFWFFKNRAAEQARRSTLREMQLSRLQMAESGWFTRYWSQVEQAAMVRKDQELLEQACAALSGSDAREVKEWPDQAAWSAAFGPDDQLLLGGIEGGKTVLFDQDGQLKSASLLGNGPVAWSPDGQPLQLTVNSNRLLLKDAVHGNLRAELVAPVAPSSSRRPITVMALSQSGEKVAAAVANRVFLWNAGTPAPVGELQREASALQFNSDASLLGVGSPDGTAHVYRLSDLSEVAVLPPAFRGSPITCLAFRRDRLMRYGAETNSWLVAVGDQGAGLVIWDLAKGTPRSFCRGSTWTIASLAFSPDGFTLASAGRNQPRL